MTVIKTFFLFSLNSGRYIVLLKIDLLSKHERGVINKLQITNYKYYMTFPTEQLHANLSKPIRRFYLLYAIKIFTNVHLLNEDVPSREDDSTSCPCSSGLIGHRIEYLPYHFRIGR
jgi:hypothetical protein